MSKIKKYAIPVILIIVAVIILHTVYSAYVASRAAGGA